MTGIMLGFVLTILFTFCPCLAAAASRAPQEAPVLAMLSEKPGPTGLKNAFYYECLQKGRIDYTCLDPADYHLWIGLARPKNDTDLDQRLSRTLNPLLAYPGGYMLHSAVMAGMELYTFSQNVTTFGNRLFHTGYSLRNTMGSSIKTGIFLNF